MARHDVGVEHVEVGALGDRQHALGSRRLASAAVARSSSTVWVVQLRRMAAGRVLREDGSSAAASTPSAGQSTSAHVHPTDSNAAVAYMRSIGGRSAIVRKLLERRLAAVLAHVDAGRRDDREQRYERVGRVEGGRRILVGEAAGSFEIARHHRRRGALCARRRRPVRPAGASARATRRADAGPGAQRRAS